MEIAVDVVGGAGGVAALCSKTLFQGEGATLNKSAMLKTNQA